MELAGPGTTSTVCNFVLPLTELMASLPWDEKVILAGHSYGGFCISLAMESFPEKVEVAIYVAAFMPRPEIPPALLLQEVQIQEDGNYDFASTTGCAFLLQVVQKLILNALNNSLPYTAAGVQAYWHGM
ncbi:methylesterase 10-like [Rhodamnia argentea]|uniref:Methylesterase 10-like n=1 Tax=Rhodamnia argentea TaxID=178133 RepID=A0ABM3GXA4_9MYRT|nr:methylesterase 10-like [Rhodamnia argentea]